MKVPAGRADAFAADPAPTARAILVHGPDRGLVGERAERLIRAIAENPADPFRVAELRSSDITTDPARLGDEAAAISMIGGRRAVVIRDAGDGLAKILESFLDEPAGDGVVILAAGELAARSNLRKLCEGAANAASIACYGDRADGIDKIVVAGLAAHGISADADARAYLAAHLGADRQVTRREIEKLALYAGDGGTVTLADAAAVIGDAGAMSLDEVAFAAAAGARERLDRELERCLGEGIQPIALLRAASRHLQRLNYVKGLILQGKSTGEAIKSLRPQIIFLYQDQFRQQVERWLEPRLADALDLLTEAEIDCKSTDMPAVAICERALMRIAQAARAPG